MKSDFIEHAIPRMRTIRQTASMLDLPEHYVRSLVRENEIVFVKAGNKVLINVDKLIEYLNIGGFSASDSNGG
ncbi:helix-turn-helix domain-containing protein [Ruminococcus sp. NK3A76]|uniref:helix-turn-helix domain-containing protein n=1 Tax=Ruminococcus sp. NK3A76 TaxID=877411 RepID=UPI0005603E40|nr:helix-turn-helix domain-containing protein [Ruminococcus sp. NK3A76]